MRKDFSKALGKIADVALSCPLPGEFADADALVQKVGEFLDLLDSARVDFDRLRREHVATKIEEERHRRAEERRAERKRQRQEDRAEREREREQEREARLAAKERAAKAEQDQRTADRAERDKITREASKLIHRTLEEFPALDQHHLAELCSVSPSLLSMVASGRRSASEELVSALKEAYRVVDEMTDDDFLKRFILRE